MRVAPKALLGIIPIMDRVMIVFETHATSLDNERGISSGHADVALSALGRRQAVELGTRYTRDSFSAVFCSDLRRSWETADLGLGGLGIPIILDPRLRECDYGALTQHPAAEIEQAIPRRLYEPFPNGESYEQAVARAKSFLDDLAATWAGRRVLVIGHRATHCALEHWLKGVPLAQTVAAPWSWQPGWTYELPTAASGA